MNDKDRVQIVTTDDGHDIATWLFTSAGPTRATVVIAPAMGVPQSWYEPLAEWLTGQGYRAATFDYRGMGRSRPDSLRGFPATVVDWARHDARAVIEHVRTVAPDQPIIWLGHSVGGQILGFAPNHESIDRVVTIAAGSGYWRDNAPALRRRVWLLWYVFGPLLTPLFGYFPGQRLNMVGDLPRGVIRQWRRWCLHPDYAAGVEPGAREGYAAIRSPIVSLSFTDDELMSYESIRSLHSLFTNAQCRMIRISPEMAGTHRIGHFGLFRSEHRDGLWTSHLLPALNGQTVPDGIERGTKPSSTVSD